MNYRRRERRKLPDRRVADLGPPDGIERRSGERRVADRRDRSAAKARTRPQTGVLGAVFRFCARVDALEERIGLKRTSSR